MRERDCGVTISIHAPRMGSDTYVWPFGWSMSLFQSTLPGWGATPIGMSCGLFHVFQSTLPGWGATSAGLHQSLRTRDFNPRSPDGERRGRRRRSRPLPRISIHAPRMGSDLHIDIIAFDARLFQSTLPGWGATAKMDIFAHDMGKIIHFQH